MTGSRGLQNMLALLPDRARAAVSQLRADTGLQEIRLRTGQPLCVTVHGEARFLGVDGRLARDRQHAPVMTAEEVDTSFRKVCRYSIYSYQNDIASGFITVEGGHRVGVCGSVAQGAQGGIQGMKHVGSLNFRVAREIKGCAKDLLPAVICDKRLSGLLLVSPPRCGKTTMLRDLARELSERMYSTVICDERSELAACYRGVPQCDLGPCCDVLDGARKSEAMMFAVRSLSPQVLVCDEIGAREDMEAIYHAVNAGVPVVASAHAGSVGELCRRPGMRALMRSGAVASVALLKGDGPPGVVGEIVRCADMDRSRAKRMWAS